MLAPKKFAQSIDGPSVDSEIRRLGMLGPEGVEMARRLSRRINGTVDWNPLGTDEARYRLMTSRGESVVFWDSSTRDRVVKLRGLPENGYETTGFGGILGRDKRGLITLQPGTLAQAVVRESLCWEHFGFGCTVEEVIGEDAGLLLEQRWVRPARGIVMKKPLKQLIRDWMSERGWQPLVECRHVSPLLRDEAWQREGMGAFDVNETNFIQSADDGLLYPIDLIVRPLPD